MYKSSPETSSIGRGPATPEHINLGNKPEQDNGSQEKQAKVTRTSRFFGHVARMASGISGGAEKIATRMEARDKTIFQKIGEKTSKVLSAPDMLANKMFGALADRNDAKIVGEYASANFKIDRLVKKAEASSGRKRERLLRKVDRFATKSSSKMASLGEESNRYRGGNPNNVNAEMAGLVSGNRQTGARGEDEPVVAAEVVEKVGRHAAQVEAPAEESPGPDAEGEAGEESQKDTNEDAGQEDQENPKEKLEKRIKQLNERLVKAQEQLKRLNIIGDYVSKQHDEHFKSGTEEDAELDEAYTTARSMIGDQEARIQGVQDKIAELNNTLGQLYTVESK